MQTDYWLPDFHESLRYDLCTAKPKLTLVPTDVAEIDLISTEKACPLARKNILRDMSKYRKYLRVPQPWNTKLASHQAIIVHDTRYGGHHLSPVGECNHSTSTSVAPLHKMEQCPVHPHRYKAAVYVSQLQIHLREQEAGYGRLVIKRWQSWHWQPVQFPSKIPGQSKQFPRSLRLLR